MGRHPLRRGSAAAVLRVALARVARAEAGAGQARVAPAEELTRVGAEAVAGAAEARNRIGGAGQLKGGRSEGEEEALTNADLAAEMEAARGGGRGEEGLRSSACGGCAQREGAARLARG